MIHEALPHNVNDHASEPLIFCCCASNSVIEKVSAPPGETLIELMSYPSKLSRLHPIESTLLLVELALSSFPKLVKFMKFFVPPEKALRILFSL